MSEILTLASRTPSSWAVLRSSWGPIGPSPGGWLYSVRRYAPERHAALGLTSKAEPHNGTCETAVAISAESRCHPGHGHHGEPDLRRGAERHSRGLDLVLGSRLCGCLLDHTDRQAHSFHHCPRCIHHSPLGQRMVSASLHQRTGAASSPVRMALRSRRDVTRPVGARTGSPLSRGRGRCRRPQLSDCLGKDKPMERAPALSVPRALWTK